MPSRKHAILSSTRHFRAPGRVVFLAFLFYLLASSFSALHAEHTRRWLQTFTYVKNSSKASAHGVAVRAADGRLGNSAPKFHTSSPMPTPLYLWSLRIDPKGALTSAGGSPVKFFRF